MKRFSLFGASLALALVLALGGQAQAQFDPESGDTGGWGGDQQTTNTDEQNQALEQEQPPGMGEEEQQGSTTSSTTTTTTTTTGGSTTAASSGGGGGGGGWYQPEENGGGQATDDETPAASTDSGESDHAQMVGSLGFQFFGVENVQTSPDTMMGVDVGDIEIYAPTIGVRYWISEMLGLDVGLGFGFADMAVNQDSGGGSNLVAGLDNQLGLNIHVGVPIAIKALQHFTVLAIPEVRFGLGMATAQALDPNDDVELFAFELEVGAKLAAEVQFGFWGVPNFSLQAAIGLGFQYYSQTSTPVDVALPITSTSGYALTTSFQDLAAGTFRAIYYF